MGEGGGMSEGGRVGGVKEEGGERERRSQEAWKVI